MGSSSASAALLLGRQFKQMQTDKDIPGISCGLVGSNVFDWEVMLMLDDESGGLYGSCLVPLSNLYGAGGEDGSQAQKRSRQIIGSCSRVDDWGC